jgi:hypothetical protein
MRHKLNLVLLFLAISKHAFAYQVVTGKSLLNECIQSSQCRHANSLQSTYGSFICKVRERHVLHNCSCKLYELVFIPATLQSSAKWTSRMDGRQCVQDFLGFIECLSNTHTHTHTHNRLGQHTNGSAFAVTTQQVPMLVMVGGGRVDRRQMEAHCTDHCHDRRVQRE